MTKRIWLITGAGSGIGKEIARQALLAGNYVAATSRTTSKLAELAAIAPERFLAIKLEITDAASRKNAVEETIERFGGLDVLVNNAGRGFHAPLEDVTSEDMHLVFETNYFGTVAMIQDALPALRQSRNGLIINISSMGVHFDNSIGNSFYVASKAALDATSKVLRNELKPFNIQVQLVEPGAFRTNFRVDGVAASGKRSDIYQESYASGDSLKSHPYDQPGDPAKAGKVIVEAAELDEVPELLILGKGMPEVEEASLKRRIEKAQASKGYAEQTDFE
ncbi:MAG: SDR family oxidoreductase [Limosilactobacillus mucosae]